MVEPASTAGAWAKIAGGVKDWPLWLFVGIALSLSFFFVVPDFRELVPFSGRTGVLFATAAAWILAVTRAVEPIAGAWRAWRAASEARIKFVVTSVEHQCFWGVSKQVDGSFVTQVSGHFMVKNRTDSALYLMTATLIKPRIKGEPLPGLLTVRAVNSNMHGTAHVSGYFIPPHHILPVSATILIRGAPKQKSGMMDAIIEIVDADANKERVRLKVRCIHPESPK